MVTKIRTAELIAKMRQSQIPSIDLAVNQLENLQGKEVTFPPVLVAAKEIESI